MPNYYSPEEMSSMVSSYDTLLDPLYKKKQQTLAETLAGTGMQYGSPAQYSYGELAAQRMGDVGQYAQKLGEQGLTQGFQSGESEKQRGWGTSERLGAQGFQSGENKLTRTENARQFDKNYDENVRQFGLDFALRQAEKNMNQAKTMMDTTGKQWTLDPTTGQWKESSNLTYGAQTNQTRNQQQLFATLSALLQGKYITPEDAKLYMGNNQNNLADILGSMKTPTQIEEETQKADPMDAAARTEFPNTGLAGQVLYTTIIDSVGGLPNWYGIAGEGDKWDFLHKWEKVLVSKTGISKQKLRDAMHAASAGGGTFEQRFDAEVNAADKFLRQYADTKATSGNQTAVVNSTPPVATGNPQIDNPYSYFPEDYL